MRLGSCHSNSRAGSERNRQKTLREVPSRSRRTWALHGPPRPQVAARLGPPCPAAPAAIAQSWRQRSQRLSPSALPSLSPLVLRGWRPRQVPGALRCLRRVQTGRFSPVPAVAPGSHGGSSRPPGPCARPGPSPRPRPPSGAPRPVALVDPVQRPGALAGKVWTGGARVSLRAPTGAPGALRAAGGEHLCTGSRLVSRGLPPGSPSAPVGWGSGGTHVGGWRALAAVARFLVYQVN